MSAAVEAQRVTIRRWGLGDTALMAIIILITVMAGGRWAGRIVESTPSSINSFSHLQPDAVVINMGDTFAFAQFNRLKVGDRVIFNVQGDLSGEDELVVVPTNLTMSTTGLIPLSPDASELATGQWGEPTGSIFAFRTFDKAGTYALVRLHWGVPTASTTFVVGR